MGAYLSKPNCEKQSEDFDGEFLRFGASSMQGWRISQEDAHCCIVDYDSGTSLFGVYDGHGGAEVAQYTSDKFPAFLKTVTAYTEERMSAALEEAFLGFDATLTTDDVKQQLNILAGGEKDLAEEDEDDAEAKNEAAMLCEEASMPIEKLLERYGGAGCVVNRPINVLKKSGVKKTLSPVIRPKPSLPPLAKSESDQVVDNGCGDGKVSEAEDDTSETASKTDICVKLADKIVNGCYNDVNGDNDQDNVTSENIKNVKNDLSLSEDKSHSTSPDADEVKSDESTLKSSTSDIKEATTNCEGDAKETSTCNSRDVSDEVNKCEKLASVSSTSCSTSDDSAAQSSSNTSAGEGSSVKPESSEEETTDEEEDSDDDGQWKEGDEEDDSDEEEGLTYCYDDDDDDDDSEEDEDEDDAEEMEEGMNFGEEPGADSGCTAVVALLRGKELYVANAGDSRCVLCRAGKAVEMSVDHKPEDTPEQDRIIKAGGRVTCDGRVNGGLNLSRAIGDHIYKRNTTVGAREQMITALPDIRSVTLDEQDEFMVLACDGIWNVMSSQDVVDFVKRRLESGVTKLSAICEEMFDFCLAPDTTGDGTGCDNMTCVIVTFNGLSSHVVQRTVTLKRKAEDVTSENADSSSNVDENVESAPKRLKDDN